MIHSMKKPQESESRSQDKYIVRLPGGMRDRIYDAAKANNRSMNAEIVARLEASFEEAPSIEKRIAKLESSLAYEKLASVQQRINSLAFASSLEQLIKAFESATIPDNHPFKKQLAEMRAMVDAEKPDLKDTLKGLLDAGEDMLKIIELAPAGDEQDGMPSEREVTKDD